MPVLEVPRHEWTERLDSFSRRHRGWLASVEQSDRAGATRTTGLQPLAQVTAEQDGPIVFAIRILFAASSGEPEVRLEKPIRVSIEQTRENAERALEIVAEDGVRARLGFRATAPPEMLDGLAPEEI